LPDLPYSYVEVEAKSISEAVSKVADGDGEEVSLEYSMTLPVSEWAYVVNNGSSDRSFSSVKKHIYK
jgi:hypothetical protein